MDNTTRNSLLACSAVVLLALPLPLAAAAPPSDAIRIDVGRQLFVDDLLIAETDLTRTFHAAELYENNPVLKPETPLERNESRGKNAIPVAAPFGDGVWFDPHDRLFKMWYHAGWFDGVGYATSKDGLHWQRPALDVVPGTNRVLPVRQIDGHRLTRDAASVWLDHAATDAAQRWKMFAYFRQQGNKASNAERGELFTSPDGIHWRTVRTIGYQVGDNSSIFQDPFRRQWVFSVRNGAVSLRDPNCGVRARFYYARSEFTDLAERKGGERLPLWLKLDARDRPDPDLGYEPELYHFTAVAYESLMVGVFGIFYGPPNEVCAKEKRPKIIDLQLGYSRDGLVYDRPRREAFLKCSRAPGAWNRGYLHPATGVCLIVGDKLHFYFGTWSGVAANRNHMYAGGSTGLATLRRDGFASMDAAAGRGSLLTRPVVFRGKYPFVNVNARAGELRMAVRGADGKVIAPYSLENCRPVQGDGTRIQLRWKGVADLAPLAGRAVQFQFQLVHGQLYSFWVSPDASGASHGYAAAGGPGLTGPMDTGGGSINAD